MAKIITAAHAAKCTSRHPGQARGLSALHVDWGVNLLLTPRNASSLEPSLFELQDLGAAAITILRPKGLWATQNWPGFPTSRELRSIAVSMKRFMKARPALRLYVDTALRGEWSTAGLLGDPEPDVLGCGGGQRHVALTPAGDVYPCSHVRWTNLQMGNLCGMAWITSGKVGPAKRRGNALRRCVMAPYALAATATDDCRLTEGTISRGLRRDDASKEGKEPLEQLCRRIPHVGFDHGVHLSGCVSASSTNRAANLGPIPVSSCIRNT